MFALSSDGSSYFEESASLDCLDEIEWKAVEAIEWSGDGVSRQIEEGKQAEFLIERGLPWNPAQEIGVRSEAAGREVMRVTEGRIHRSKLEQALTAAPTRTDSSQEYSASR